MKTYKRVVNGREYQQKVTTKTISISIPLYEAVKEYATAHGMSIAEFTRQALNAKMFGDENK